MYSVEFGSELVNVYGALKIGPYVSMHSTLVGLRSMLTT
jgi:hypothetical protein